ncbi:MAG: SPOR domain-containing protein [Marinobacter sp.]|uniref:SPOR domain-containing protein n=1 Tax=Marinobacter sp. TaxID=50741 RepID=UPI00299E4447|nr:SPOR domain-containing protein [Marinobacter sp.]MDX1757227.1 SPOR domain-containing protein [Marinobacter sp.]
MSNQDRQPNVPDQQQGQEPMGHQEASASAEPPLLESVVEEAKTESAALVPFSESVADKRFARDINAKIDEVEGQVQFLVDAFTRSQQALRGVMGDVKSQTALVTSEIERVTGLMQTADAEQRERLSALDQRLQASVAELTRRLGGVDEQLHAHQDDIGRLKTELDESQARLADRLQSLETDTQRNIDQLSRQDEVLEQELTALAKETERGFEHSKSERETLFATQQVHQTRQEAMATHLECLQEQADQQGEGLAELGTTVADHHVENRRQHRLFAVVSAVVVLLLVAAVSYLELAPSASSEQLQAQVGGIETQVAGIESQVEALEPRVAAAESVSTEVGDLDSKVTGLEAQVSTLEKELKAAGTVPDSLEDIANKVAALELSVYGPPEADLPATPVLTIEDASWVAERNASHYSIQLLGAYREGSVVAYTNQHAESLGDHPLSLTQSEYRGRSWYNLFYGDFASFDAALAALNALPPGLQQNGPWIRTLSSIQQSAIQ